LHRIVVSAMADTELRRAPDGKIHFIRALASLDDRGDWRLRPMAGQDSHQLLAMAVANALAVLPDGEGIESGGKVDVLLTDPERLSADEAAGGDRPW
jgi:molybdopterin molybdotransferase